MMELTVVRHGESLGNLKDVIDDNISFRKDKNGLSKKGKIQAKEVARKLLRKKFDVIIVSPLIRTQETLEPFLADKNYPVIISELTLERNAGIFTGKSRGAIKEYCLKNHFDRLSFKPKNGESILDVYQRAKKFLNYLKKNFEGKKVLLCGHVNFLGCLDIILEDGDLKKFYSHPHLKNGEIKLYIIN